MIEVTLLGTGSPIPDARRAGPATLVRAGSQTFLVDCGRGVQQRMTAAGVAANGLTALLLTHLHSDHIADLGDLIITRWVTTFTPEPNPLRIVGPPGTAEVVDATLKAFGFDIGYRIAHHADLNAPPDIFTAFEQQLGLKLQATKAVVDVIVIDRIERPSPN